VICGYSNVIHLIDSFFFLLQDFNSVLVNGSCQIPDPLYKLIGSIVSFYIPLGVMILTYTLTVRHLAAKRQNLQTGFTHNSNQSNFEQILCKVIVFRSSWLQLPAIVLIGHPMPWLTQRL